MILLKAKHTETKQCVYQTKITEELEYALRMDIIIRADKKDAKTERHVLFTQLKLSVCSSFAYLFLSHPVL